MEVTPHDAIEAQAGDWSRLVCRIRGDDPEGMEELYAIFSRGIRFHMCRVLGPEDLDDKVHDTFLIVVEAIRRGDLRDPERLMGFVRTVVRRQVANYIGRAADRRRHQQALDPGAPVADARSDPERAALERELRDLMGRVLGGVGRRDREILRRFYLLGQSQEEICADLGLSRTQFRLLKSRAKTRFGQLGRRQIRLSLGSTFFLRTAASV